MKTIRPRTEKQIAASRSNGQHSKGPITARGKAISSLNALKHGEHSRAFQTILPDIAEVAAIVKEYTLDLKPQSDEDRHLIRTAAEAKSRQTQARKLEAAAPPNRKAMYLEADFRFTDQFLNAIRAFQELRRNDHSIPISD